MAESEDGNEKPTEPVTPPSDPTTPSMGTALMMHELYQNYLAVGFTDEQSLELLNRLLDRMQRWPSA